MNFFIDAYDLLIKGVAYTIAFPFTETLILSFGSYYIIKKMGGTKFLWIKLRSLRPAPDEDQGLERSKRFKFFNDILSISLVLVVCVKGPLLLISLAKMDLFFFTKIMSTKEQMISTNLKEIACLREQRWQACLYFHTSGFQL